MFRENSLALPSLANKQEAAASARFVLTESINRLAVVFGHDGGDGDYNHGYDDLHRIQRRETEQLEAEERFERENRSRLTSFKLCQNTARLNAFLGFSR